MRTQPIGIVFFVLSSAGFAFGPNTPTGIVNSGNILLLRSESKIALGSAPPIDATADMFQGSFSENDFTNYTAPPQLPYTTIGPCYVYTVTLPQTQPPPSGEVQTPLDAGPFLNVNGPNGAMQIPQKNSVYFMMVGGGIAIPAPFPIPGLPAVLPPYLDPGSYEVDNGGGGADVGPFMAAIDVPSPGFLWTNADADLTVTLANGVDIQFSGGDPDAMVTIQGGVTTPTLLAGFSCLVPNNGEYFVPSAVTSMLPATPAGSTTGSSLSVSSTTLANFTAPGLDMGILSYEAGNTRQVVYQ